MIFNITKRKIVSRSPHYATGLLDRGRGMIGRNFSSFDAMVFEKCNSIHTMFMSIRIDVIFVSFDNTVCLIRESACPWLPLIRSSDAAAVIELPEGVIKSTDTRKGDILDLKAELSENGRDIITGKSFLPGAEAVIPLSESK